MRKWRSSCTVRPSTERARRRGRYRVPSGPIEKRPLSSGRSSSSIWRPSPGPSMVSYVTWARFSRRRGGSCTFSTTVSVGCTPIRSWAVASGACRHSASPARAEIAVFRRLGKRSSLLMSRGYGRAQEAQIVGGTDVCLVWLFLSGFSAPFFRLLTTSRPGRPPVAEPLPVVALRSWPATSPRLPAITAH